MAANPDWNASDYHKVSDVQFRWGLEVLADLQLRGDEIVIDAGCGTGRLTSILAERLTSGRVIALDVSESMLEVARSELQRFDDRVACTAADLGALTLHNVADVIFSNATLHWVLDHAAMFKGLHRALKSGGRLHAQCGGVGNLERFLALVAELRAVQPYAPYFKGFSSPTQFAAVEPTLQHLKAAGFVDCNVWLSEAPTPFENRDAFKAFVSTVVLRHAAGLLPADLLQPFLDEVVSRSEKRAEGLSLDYVRLNIRATAEK